MLKTDERDKKCKESEKEKSQSLPTSEKVTTEEQLQITVDQFLGVQYSVVNCGHNVVQKISRSYSSCITETLCPLTGD